MLIPRNIQELMKLCDSIAGKTIFQLASILNKEIPVSLHKNKGWVGQLIEELLGATAANKAELDFLELEIELKTLPLNARFEPMEATYVCTVAIDLDKLIWQHSWVKKKLSHVLWVPIEADHAIPVAQRKIGTPFLWQPSKADRDILQQDWEELITMMQLGNLQNLNANYGHYLHIRPKAANSKVLINYINSDGDLMKMVPKGFYLRTIFTKKILAEKFNLKINY